MYKIPRVKISMVRESHVSSEYKVVSSSKESAAIVRTMLGNNDREEFVVLLLDAKHKISAVHSVSVGTLTLSLVHPREVYKAAILANSAAIIMAHNHPSGDCTPSQEDKVLTKRLCDAGKILGIAVLDHIVLGEEDQYFSFADNGIL